MSNTTGSLILTTIEYLNCFWLIMEISKVGIFLLVRVSGYMRIAEAPDKMIFKHYGNTVRNDTIHKG